MKASAMAVSLALAWLSSGSRAQVAQEQSLARRWRSVSVAEDSATTAEGGAFPSVSLGALLRELEAFAASDDELAGVDRGLTASAYAGGLIGRGEAMAAQALGELSAWEAPLRFREVKATLVARYDMLHLVSRARHLLVESCPEVAHFKGLAGGAPTDYKVYCMLMDFHHRVSQVNHLVSSSGFPAFYGIRAGAGGAGGFAE
eukprot:CAMPEP_0118977572 /NCGR_PEP_ID=MMETSP1173-20130426/21718_1 /TAXON_ID=1034831 /ORGANISM="Rhizochromulina marina cf, Strain CCMP1243" /LENGTH=201 /DNA_ID=CAMNT_0006927693 /DNA_START=1 /DNA_END=606 /DNA_ORIENTATION=-